MPQTATVIIYIFFNVLSLSLLPSKSSSFTLELTHRDSPLSPLFQSNLSHLQRLIKHVEISTARADYLQLLDKGNTIIRLPSIYQDPIFTVEIGIGTPPVKRTLIFDTGSGLTWTQCKPCLSCFKQNEPLFDPRTSSSYLTMPKKHPLAGGFSCPFFNNGRACSYRMDYYSGQFSAGVASMEAFSFHTNVGPPARVSNLVFGCGTRAAGKFPVEISGIAGFNKQPYSFTRQLSSFINGRFSYCLSTLGRPSYVTFGDEAVIRGRNAQKTPFLNNSRRNRMLYALTLLDLSINGQKLRLGQSAFPQGCLIDSGSSVGLLNRRAFSAATAFLDNYFSKFGNVIKRYEGDLAPKTMHCYTLPAGFRSFPEVVFHFQGADYHVPPQNLFVFIQGKAGIVFCLAMVESRDVTILGAYQQRNVRVVYDLKGGALSFAPEAC